jgi:hypothetical protein
MRLRGVLRGVRPRGAVAERDAPATGRDATRARGVSHAMDAGYSVSCDAATLGDASPRRTPPIAVLKREAAQMRHLSRTRTASAQKSLPRRPHSVAALIMGTGVGPADTPRAPERRDGDRRRRGTAPAPNDTAGAERAAPLNDTAGGQRGDAGPERHASAKGDAGTERRASAQRGAGGGRHASAKRDTGARQSGGAERDAARTRDARSCRMRARTAVSRRRPPALRRASGAPAGFRRCP